MVPASYRVKQKSRPLSSRTFQTCIQHLPGLYLPMLTVDWPVGRGYVQPKPMCSPSQKGSLHFNCCLKWISVPISHAVTGDKFTKHLPFLLPPLSGGSVGLFIGEGTLVQEGTDHSIPGPPAADTHFNVNLKKPIELILDELC